jgi:ABC-type phosphate transport system substrate-binding protein
MITSRLTRWTRTAAVFAAASAFAASAAMVAANTASADPHNAGATKVGVGSDTIQDVMNAMAGERDCPQPNNDTTRFYGAISSAAFGGAIGSFDAVPCGSPATQASCIRTVAGGPVFDRPNGSSQGINALNAAIAGTGYQNPSVRCTAAAVVIGINNLHFARSSRGPNDTTTSTLSWVPFARDGVTFVYVTNGPTQAEMQGLTTANLTSLYTNQTLPNFGAGNGTVYPCLPQPGSGTRSFYETAIGVADGTAALGPTAIGCNNLEEHDGNAFDSFATTFLSTHPNSAVVQAFSAAQYIAQSTGAAQDRSNNFRADGNGGIGNPPQIAGGPIVAGAPNATYYNDGTWGRFVYNVFQSTRIGTGLTQDRQLKAIFNINNGAGAAGDANGLCGAAAGTTIGKFGFLTIGATCGTITATGKS